MPVCFILCFCGFCVFSVVCFELSAVTVEVIAWKDSSPKCVERDVKLYSLTQLHLLLCITTASTTQMDYLGDKHFKRDRI